MGTGLSTGCPSISRQWGKCSRNCLHRSKIYKLEHKGVHCVFFGFKHWCVYLYTICEEHGDQRWTVEKQDEIGKPEADYQCFWNRHVVMWCGYYASYVDVEKQRRISSRPLISAYNVAMKWKNNGYDLLDDNCATFANEFDDKLPF